MKSNDNRITVRVPEELRKQMIKRSKMECLPNSTIVNTALSKYLNNEDDFEIVFKDLRRLTGRIDDVKRNVDLSIEILLAFVKKFYFFFEAWETVHGEGNFKKDEKYDAFIDEILDTMLTQGLFSEQVDAQVENITR